MRWRRRRRRAPGRSSRRRSRSVAMAGASLCCASMRSTRPGAMPISRPRRRLPIDAVLLPKVESADRVRLTVSLLDALGAPGAARGLVHARDAARHSLGARDRRSEPEARRTRSRHLGPDQGTARALHPRSSAADHLPRPRDSRRPRPRAGGPRRRPSRPLRSRRASRSPAGRAASSASTARR